MNAIVLVTTQLVPLFQIVRISQFALSPETIALIVLGELIARRRRLNG